ncbi:MAG: dioxygenase [Gammaproteobacteria bacterium]|nr:dioxygenase [Gammaproteobacteria bacterium]
MTNRRDSRIRALYLSHGGGPLPLLGDEGHREMVANLEQIAREIERPSAILVVSAHWEERVPTLTAGANPSLIYDYYGFPDAAYTIRYPAPGAPGIAEDVFTALAAQGFEPRMDGGRGFDHGLFVPLKIMYPEADIPCIQLSLLNHLDAAEHIRLGRALAGLGHDGLLVIGSGFSFHNMKGFWDHSDEARKRNEAFEDWLMETCSSRALNEAERTNRLERWADAPFARYCHPREEHLLPLHVCYGLAGRAGSAAYSLHILNRKASVYLW